MKFCNQPHGRYISIEAAFIISQQNSTCACFELLYKHTNVSNKLLLTPESHSVW